MDKPALLRLHEMPPGQKGDFFALLSEKTRNARRDGKPFFTCRFRDNQRTVTFMVWADGPWFETCQHEWREGQFFKIRGTYLDHPTYGPQIEIHAIRPLTDADRSTCFDPRDFIDHTRRDVAEMFDELCTLARTHIKDGPLQQIVIALLTQHEPKIKILPASPKQFYPFAGGLLEHLLSVTHTCLHLAEKYREQYADLQPPLNQDLIVAGAILHDIGRVAELGDDLVQPQPTIPGRLVGHVILGRDLVRDQARAQGDVNPELLQMLEHLILSHLDLPAWGSPRLPMIPECLILHHADDLDAKMEMYARCLKNDDEPGAFTARDPILGKPLFKGRKV